MRDEDLEAIDREIMMATVVAMVAMMAAETMAIPQEVTPIPNPIGITDITLSPRKLTTIIKVETTATMTPTATVSQTTATVK